MFAVEKHAAVAPLAESSVSVPSVRTHLAAAGTDEHFGLRPMFPSVDSAFGANASRMRTYTKRSRNSFRIRTYEIIRLKVV